MTCCLWHSGRVSVTFRVKYDISGELVRHTGLTVTYWVTVTYCGPTTSWYSRSPPPAATSTRREMSRNVEKCRVLPILSKSLLQPHQQRLRRIKKSRNVAKCRVLSNFVEVAVGGPLFYASAAILERSYFCRIFSCVSRYYVVEILPNRASLRFKNCQIVEIRLLNMIISKEKL